MFLIADPVHPLLTNGLADAGIPFAYEPEITANQLAELLPILTALLVRNRPLTGDLLQQAPKLRLIARAGSGVDNIDTEAAARQGITLLHAAGANADAVGEHAVGMLLMLLHKLATANMEVRKGIWQREANRGNELGAKTVAIIGYGHTGQAVAKRLCGFGVKVLAFDKYKTGFGNELVEETGMTEIFEQADVVSLHVPLTPETRNLVSLAFLSRFARPVVLMNLCRGEVVNTSHLVQAMKQGLVSGCCLDVLENENPGSYTGEPWFHYLATQKNVVLSPHVAGWSNESFRNISALLLPQLLQVLPK